MDLLERCGERYPYWQPSLGGYKNECAIHPASRSTAGFTLRAAPGEQGESRYFCPDCLMGVPGVGEKAFHTEGPA